MVALEDQIIQDQLVVAAEVAAEALEKLNNPALLGQLLLLH